MHHFIKFKDRAYFYFAEKNWGVLREYGPYVDTHQREHLSAPWKHWWLLIRLNWHYRILRKTSYLLSRNASESSENDTQLDLPESQALQRDSAELLFARLKEYDVISFDIFDTLILRKVQEPKDVFSILAAEMGFNDFARIRPEAERFARRESERLRDNHEITLADIYQVLSEQYAIDTYWMKREIEIEKDLCIANPYMKSVYDQLRSAGKTIILATDMYLPRETLESILQSNGYIGYDHLFLSNELMMSKSTGTLQRHICETYLQGRSAIHIGDNYESDVIKSARAGFRTEYYPSSRELSKNFKEANLDGLSGSFYRAIINNSLNTGMWNENLYYEHGFKVGGILSCGYCQHINHIAEVRQCDLILFCARDCDIIHQVYNQYYKKIDNAYIPISRFAVFNIAPDRYLYDLFARAVIGNARKNPHKDIAELLGDAGLGYLVPMLNEANLVSYIQPNARVLEQLKKFVLGKRDIVIQNNQDQIEGAKKYFGALLKGYKHILIADVGWSGTCITALKYFFEQHFEMQSTDVCGTLICADRNTAINISVMNGTIFPYITSAFNNVNIAQKQFSKNKQRNNMCLEYLFTSPTGTFEAYGMGADGEPALRYSRSIPANKDEIREMQRGVLGFAKQFHDITASYATLFNISPYVAYAPFLNTLDREAYIRSIFRNFNDDPIAMIYSPTMIHQSKNVEIHTDGVTDKKARKILLVTHELSYTGAPHSLLRICKVLLGLQYEVVVWSPKEGAFSKEYQNLGVSVQKVTAAQLQKPEIIAQIKKFDVAILNTIFTDEYACQISELIPIIWYIREATNIPECCKNSSQRFSALCVCQDLYCVSEYAAEYIKQFNSSVQVVNNCVEDISQLAVTSPKAVPTVRFLQLGTLEYRKGYDVLLDAYSMLPPEYRSKSELLFAGQCRPGFKEFWTSLLAQADSLSGVHYLGEITDTNKKVQLFSEIDVVIVASRDESCSLVALEGAMLSKPLIVTENVGAKYIVSPSNGIIIKTGGVLELAKAMITMIDRNAELPQMGAASRQMYERYASMDKHRRDIQQMIERRIALGVHPMRHLKKDHLPNLSMGKNRLSFSDIEAAVKGKKIILSLTSHPPRIAQLHLCVKTLLQQTVKPAETILWLAEEQFPNKEGDLPKKLLNLQRLGLTIRWCDDLGSHKKYYYAVKENPDAIIITVDDDVLYPPDLVYTLCVSYAHYPHAVSALRMHRITLDESGNIRRYDRWVKEDSSFYCRPSFLGMATGVGGILYPPGSLNSEVFCKERLLTMCPNCDDIWLKIMTLANGYPAVLASPNQKIELVKATQHCALYNDNVFNNANDLAIQKALAFYNQYFGNPSLLERLQYPLGRIDWEERYIVK